MQPSHDCSFLLDITSIVVPIPRNIKYPGSLNLCFAQAVESILWTEPFSSALTSHHTLTFPESLAHRNDNSEQTMADQLYAHKRSIEMQDTRNTETSSPAHCQMKPSTTKLEDEITCQSRQSGYCKDKLTLRLAHTFPLDGVSNRDHASPSTLSDRVDSWFSNDVAYDCTGEKSLNYSHSRVLGVLPENNRKMWFALDNLATWMESAPRICWVRGLPGAGKTVLSSRTLSLSGTIRRALPGKQLYTMTDRLPIYEKKIWFNLEPGADLEDKENGTDMSVLHLATSKLPDAVSLLSASASAIVATAWNNANNQAIIRSQHQVIETVTSNGVRKIVPEEAIPD